MEQVHIMVHSSLPYFVSKLVFFSNILKVDVVDINSLISMSIQIIFEYFYIASAHELSK